MNNNCKKYLIIIACFCVASSVWAKNDISQGTAAADKDNFSQAVIHYRNALKEKRSFKAYLGLAHAQSRLGQWNKAVEAYRSAIEMTKEKSSLELLENLGRAEYMAEKFDNAVDTFQTIYANRPDYDSEIWLARCYIKTNQWTRGQDMLLKSLASKPQNSQTLELLAYLFAQSDRVDEAVSIHKKLVKSHPEQTKYLLTLAKTQTTAEDYDQAIDTLEFADRIETDSSKEAVRLLADLYINKKMYRQAAFCYQRIIVNSDSPSVEDYFRLGYAYYQTSEFLSASQAFEKIMQIDPSNSKAPAFLGHIAAKKGETETARQYYLEAIKANKSSKEPYLSLAELEFENENYNKAAIQFAKAISLDEQLVSAHYNYVLSLMLSNQFNHAKTAIKNALRKHPTNAKLNNLLSRLINETIVDIRQPTQKNDVTE